MKGFILEEKGMCEYIWQTIKPEVGVRDPVWNEFLTWGASVCSAEWLFEYYILMFKSKHAGASHEVMADQTHSNPTLG